VVEGKKQKGWGFNLNFGKSLPSGKGHLIGGRKCGLLRQTRRKFETGGRGCKKGNPGRSRGKSTERSPKIVL